ncbi:MAG: hypothetical protein ACLT8E_11100 [Akkermansia sp.]
MRPSAFGPSLPPAFGRRNRRRQGTPSAEAQAVPRSVPDTALIDDASDRPVAGQAQRERRTPAPQHPAAAPAGTEDSPSNSAVHQRFRFQQFHVTGMDSLLAGAIATRADSIRTALVKTRVP